MTAPQADPLAPRELLALLREAGLGIAPDAAAKLSLHAREMIRWNRAIRLTAITDPLGVAVKHIADSLLLLAFGPFPGRTLDFGSGAGYPGIPLAVCAPESRVVLLEATAKKCAFLTHVRSLLGLENVEVIHGRLERRRPAAFGAFDHVVARAAAPAAATEEIVRPSLAPGGRILLLAGPEVRAPGDGETAAPGGARIERRREFSLPRGMGRRVIREIRFG